MEQVKQIGYHISHSGLELRPRQAKKETVPLPCYGRLTARIFQTEEIVSIPCSSYTARSIAFLNLRRAYRRLHFQESIEREDSGDQAPWYPRGAAQPHVTSRPTWRSSAGPKRLRKSHPSNESLSLCTPVTLVVYGKEYDHLRLEGHVKLLLYLESNVGANCGGFHSDVAKVYYVRCDIIDSCFQDVGRDGHGDLIGGPRVVGTHTSMDT